MSKKENEMKGEEREKKKRMKDSKLLREGENSE